MDKLSAGWVFIVYCVLLRMVEGIGTAMYITATFTILPLLFPKHVGTSTVSDVLVYNFHRYFGNYKVLHYNYAFHISLI